VCLCVYFVWLSFQSLYSLCMYVHMCAYMFSTLSLSLSSVL
jgi:hypothetical protein